MAARRNTPKKKAQRTRPSSLARRRSTGASTLFDRVSKILEESRGTVVREVNRATVAAYWMIGREIVDAVQRGAARAEYGERVIEELSKRLADRYGAGFSVANLRRFRQFYLAYSDRDPAIRSPAGRELSARKSSPTGSESGAGAGFDPALSWSHSVLAESRQLFAARYLTYLPTEKELERELERERRLLEAVRDKGA